VEMIVKYSIVINRYYYQVWNRSFNAFLSVFENQASRFIRRIFKL